MSLSLLRGICHWNHTFRFWSKKDAIIHFIPCLLLKISLKYCRHYCKIMPFYFSIFSWTLHKHLFIFLLVMINCIFVYVAGVQKHLSGSVTYPKSCGINSLSEIHHVTYHAYYFVPLFFEEHDKKHHNFATG